MPHAGKRTGVLMPRLVETLKAVRDVWSPAKAAVRPASQTIASPLPDLEAELMKELYRPAHEITARYNLPLRYSVAEAKAFHAEKGTYRSVSGRIKLIEMRRTGGRWEPVPVTVLVQNAKELRDLSETRWFKQTRAFEAYGDPFAYGDDYGYGRTDTGLIDQEYVPILGGPFHKQLYLYDMLSAHSKAFELKNHHPLAKNIIETTTRLSLGRSFTVKIKNAKLHDLWDDFAKRNRLMERLSIWSDDLTWQGELMLRRNEILPGMMKVWAQDVSTCWEIVTHPEDLDKIFYYHIQYPTQWQLYPAANIPVSKYIIEQVGPGMIRHYKLNVSSGEKRGRSDLYCVMTWLKRFRDYYTSVTLKAQLEAQFVWKVKIKGNQDDVSAYASMQSALQLPAPGGTWIENEALDLEPMAANFAAGSGQSRVGQDLANIVAAGVEFPGEYFNIAGSGPSRIATLTKTEPIVKKVQARQDLLRQILHDLWDDVMAFAVQSGRCTWDEVAKEDPQFELPTIYEEDREKKITALGTAVDRKAISHRRMASTMAAELDYDDYEYGKEIQEIQQEQDNPLLQMFPGMGGAPEGEEESSPSGRNDTRSGVLDAERQFKKPQLASGADAMGPGQRSLVRTKTSEQLYVVVPTVNDVLQVEPTIRAATPMGREVVATIEVAAPGDPIRGTIPPGALLVDTRHGKHLSEILHETFPVIPS